MVTDTSGLEALKVLSQALLSDSSTPTAARTPRPGTVFVLPRASSLLPKLTHFPALPPMLSEASSY